MEIPKEVVDKLPKKVQAALKDPLIADLPNPIVTCALKNDGNYLTQIALALLAKPGLEYIKKVLPDRWNQVAVQTVRTGKLVKFGPVALDIANKMLVVPVAAGFGVSVFEFDVEDEYFDVMIRKFTVGDVQQDTTHVPPFLALMLLSRKDPDQRLDKPLSAYTCNDSKGTKYSFRESEEGTFTRALSKFI